MKEHFFLKINLHLIIFIPINILIFLSLPSLIQSKELKQLAVISVLSKDYIPLVSEQILLKRFKDELSKKYDFSYQSNFEIAYKEIRDLESSINCEKLIFFFCKFSFCRFWFSTMRTCYSRS